MNSTKAYDSIKQVNIFIDFGGNNISYKRPLNQPTPQCNNYAHA